MKRTPFVPGNQLAKGNPGQPSKAEVMADVILVMKRLGEGETIGRLHEWMAEELHWTPSHAATILKHARGALSERMRETAEETRTRLLAACDAYLSRCEEYVLGSGGQNSGSVLMRDPDGQLLTKLNHKAIQGYMRLVMDLTGTAIAPAANSNDHRPMRERSTAELLKIVAEADAEVAMRATEAEDVAVHPKGK